MKKRHLLVMAVLVVAMGLAIVVPASACTQGCTPGYWKQPHHFDSWPAPYVPGMQFREAFEYEGVQYGPEDMTLLQALQAKGGGENAFLRHAVAALLNAEHSGVVYYHPSWVKWYVSYAYKNEAFEWVKDILAANNELGCPLN